MSDQILALIRTAWQAVIAAFVAWLISLGIDIDSGAVMAATWPIVMFLYYAVAQWLAGQIPGAAWLLGPGPAPTYQDE